MDKVKPIIIASDRSWIEGDAIRQLEITAALPGMKRAVGLPDLHPGKGIPIGAAFLSKSIIYPHLVGNDIGCGMGLWQTDIAASKFKLDKSVKKLTGFEEPWEGDSAQELASQGLPTDLWPYALGTIGSGNHFAEFQRVETILDEALFKQSGLNKQSMKLLVHSGSRGLGQSILERHARKYGGDGLVVGSDEFDLYVSSHDEAVHWAEFNRRVIAKRFMSALRTDGDRMLDICHNSVTPHEDGWLHRKGAAPSDKGLVVIPGSRGTLSYIVRPRLETADLSLWSLAHGAGRKWKRSDVKGPLMFEEAPEAYKDVAVVIDDLENAGLIDVVATLRPLITYKTRRR